MKAIELRKKSKLELDNLLKGKEEKLGEARVANNNRQLSDITEIKKIKKDIARIKTVLNNQEYQKVESKNN